MKAFTLVSAASMFAILFLAPFLAWSQAAPDASPPSGVGVATDLQPAQPALEEIERAVTEAKARVKALNDESEAASRDLNQATNALDGARQNRFIMGLAGTLLQPLRLISPLLTNIGFIFGAIALLYIVVTRPNTARALLSGGYPFSIRPRHPESPAPPMSDGARWVWGIILAIMLLLLALPALSQEPASAAAGSVPVDNTEPADTPAAETVATTPAPDDKMQAQMDLAAKYMEMTPLERAIHVMENAPENTSVRLVLGIDVLELARSAANQHGHPPLIEIKSPPEPEKLDLKKDTPGYFFVLASLYEAQNKSGACELLAKGVEPFTQNPTTLKNIPFTGLNALLLWLSTCDNKDLAKPLIMPAAEAAPDVSAVKGIVAVAEKLGLTDEIRKCVESSVSRVKAIEEVERLSDFALEKGFQDLALKVLEDSISLYNIETQIRVVKRIHALGDPTRTTAALAALSSGANLSGLMTIAQCAAELDLKETFEGILELALKQASRGSEVDTVLAAAAQHDCLARILAKLQADIESSGFMAQWGLPPRFPAEFGASVLEKEDASLASVVAANLFSPEAKDKLRPLFEDHVMRQLDQIVQSLGAKPEMRLNDLYVLARYYELTSHPALEPTRHMVALQQRLRGLDKAAASEADAKRLALQMEQEQLREQVNSLQKAIAETRAQTTSARNDLTEIRIKNAQIILEFLAKGILILLGLWIAFSRAIASARGAADWVFSHFCWKFVETVGFECCCTVVLLPAGIPLALLGQDRLKHLRIAELPAPPEPNKSASVDLPAKRPDVGE